MSVLDQLAEHFSPKIPGVDWDAIVTQAGRLELTLWSSTAPEVALYLAQMTAARNRAKSAIDTLNMPWDLTSTESKIAWEAAKQNMLSVSDVTLSALKQNLLSLLPGGKKYLIDQENLRAVVASLYMAAEYGYLASVHHLPQVSTMSAQDIRDYSDEVTKAFNLIVFWDTEGMLAPFKKAPLKGPEIAVIPAIALTIVATALIAGLAWAIVTSQKISATNSTMESMCKKAEDTKDPEILSACLELSGQNQVALNAGPPNIGATLMTYAAVGVGVYALFVFGPVIAKSLRSTT